jgi:hypothetical protein
MLRAMSSNTNWLVVEGRDDLFSVIGLMCAHVAWPKTRGGAGAPVHIEIGNGVDDILADAYIPTLLKSPEIKILGVMVDADTKTPDGRYQRLRQLCSPQFPQMPMSLPMSGLIVNDTSGKRLGFWVMPDNLSPVRLKRSCDI